MRPVRESRVREPEGTGARLQATWERAMKDSTRSRVLLTIGLLAVVPACAKGPFHIPAPSLGNSAPTCPGVRAAKPVSILVVHVIDNFANPIPNAEVLVLPSGTRKATRSIRVDPQGHAAFHDLEDGTYDLQVSQRGFRATSASGLLVKKGCVTAVVISLEM